MQPDEIYCGFPWKSLLKNLKKIHFISQVGTCELPSHYPSKNSKWSQTFHFHLSFTGKRKRYHNEMSNTFKKTGSEFSVGFHKAYQLIASSVNLLPFFNDAVLSTGIINRGTIPLSPTRTEAASAITHDWYCESKNWAGRLKGAEGIQESSQDSERMELLIIDSLNSE